jgi:hypothetical protein
MRDGNYSVIKFPYVFCSEEGSSKAFDSKTGFHVCSNAFKASSSVFGCNTGLSGCVNLNECNVSKRLELPTNGTALRLRIPETSAAPL